MTEKRTNTKTINEVTKKEFVGLVEAAIDLLAASRFVYWEYELEKEEDPPFGDSLNEMAAALEAIGLPQGTQAEFNRDMEETLKLTPQEFWERVQKNRSLKAERKAARGN